MASSMVVYVTRNGKINRFGVAIRIDDGKDTDAELLGFLNGDTLAIRVDDEDVLGQVIHVFDTCEIFAKLIELTLKHEDFFLGTSLLIERSRLFHSFEFFQTGNGFTYGIPVRQKSARPAGIDVEHLAAFRFALNGATGLLLRTYEENLLAAMRMLAQSLIGLFRHLHRLLKIDDMDTVTSGEDVGCHARIPLAGLVPEVYAGLKKRFH